MAKQTSQDLTAPAHVAIEALGPPRRLPFDAPWNWLALGWRDVSAVPGISLTYGAAFATAAALVVFALARLEALSLAFALAGGGLLLGPFLAVGLYETSRRLEQGQAISLGEAIWSVFGSQGQLGFFGMVLLFIFLVWLQTAFLLLMLFIGTPGLPPPRLFMYELLIMPRGLGLLIVGTLVGGLLAALVFAISVVAVPMLLVRRVDAVTAARASLTAVMANPLPMALWAALIVAIMTAGLLTVVGLAVAFPLIGHATWHAYGDVYRDS